MKEPCLIDLVSDYGKKAADLLKYNAKKLKQKESFTLMNIFDNKLRLVLFLTALLCVVYSLVVFRAGSGTYSFAIWLALALIFLLCAGLSRSGYWNQLSRLSRQIIGAACGIVVVVFIMCQVSMLSHFFDRGEDNLDYIIVLGAQMKSNGPSVVYKYRLDKAYEYLLENENTMCVVTGGIGANENISEGEGGRNYLVSKGISDERIIVESASLDTVGNILNAETLIDSSIDENTRIGIVTNNFHLFRGIKIAEKYIDSKICGIAATANPIYLPNNMMRECLGIVRDYINGDM